jgi:esterase/lipase
VPTRYRSDDNRTGFIFIYGNGSSSPQLHEEVQRAGHTIECVQLADHGCSHNVLATWQSWHRACELVLADMTSSCDKIIVVGTGVAGLVGLGLAADNQSKVHGAIAVRPIWSFKLPVIQRISSALANISFILANTYDHGNYARCFPEASAEKVRWKVAIEHRMTIEIIKKMRSMRRPTLIIQPRTDIYTQLKSTEYLQRHLAGPVYLTLLSKGTLASKDCSLVKIVLAFASKIERTAGSGQILPFPVKGPAGSDPCA